MDVWTWTYEHKIGYKGTNMRLYVLIDNTYTLVISFAVFSSKHPLAYHITYAKYMFVIENNLRDLVAVFLIDYPTVLEQSCHLCIYVAYLVNQLCQIRTLRHISYSHHGRNCKFHRNILCKLVISKFSTAKVWYPAMGTIYSALPSDESSSHIFPRVTFTNMD